MRGPRGKEADDWLRPRRGVAGIDGARAQFSLDEIDTATHDVGRHRLPNDDISVSAEVLDDGRHLGSARDAGPLREAIRRTPA
jgi:hypothetical protein